MLFQLRSDTVAHNIKVNAEAFSPDEFHRGHDVAITGNNNNGGYKFAQGEAGQVQADPEVYTLLVNIWHQVSCFYLPGCLDE